MKRAQLAASCVLLAILSATPGCSRPPAQANPEGQGQAPAQAVEPGKVPFVKGTARYQGKTAVEWARDLPDRDPQMSGKAAEALCVIGDDGIPYLVEAVEGKDKTAWNAVLGAMSTCSVYAENTAPLLQAVAKVLTADPDPGNRWTAAEASMAFGRASIPVLRDALDKEREPRVRQVIARQLQILQPPKQ